MHACAHTYPKSILYQIKIPLSGLNIFSSSILPPLHYKALSFYLTSLKPEDSSFSKEKTVWWGWRTRWRHAPQEKQGKPRARSPHAQWEIGEASLSSQLGFVHFWQTFNSFCCFPSQHIYLCNVTRSREGVRRRGGGRGKKLFHGLPAPLHMLLLYKGCLESHGARSKCCKTHTHTHLPPKEQLQKRELPLERRKPIIKVLIHKQWLPSETDFSSWKKEGGEEVF